jgi:hypothetical protein
MPPGARNAAKTHCPAGHEYAVHAYSPPSRPNARYCRACARDRGREVTAARRRRGLKGPRPPVDRFVEKVVVDEATGCHVWTGARYPFGHGAFRDGGRTMGAHKWLWEFLNGPVAEGLELDHLCRNPPCVNPAHLEPVTHAENVRRGAASLPGRPTRRRRRAA